MKKIVIFISIVIIFSCKAEKQHNDVSALNKIATEYVNLGLNIGKYDPDFVDAYYGPDSLKPNEGRLEIFPKYIFLTAVHDLLSRLSVFINEDKNDSLSMRAKWISSQLIAFKRRIYIFAGERKSFDEESKELFGVVAPVYPESYYQGLVGQLNDLLPGKEGIADRFQAMANHFIIPKNKLDTVFKMAIAASRQRTLAHIDLPAKENFSLEYVTHKPWSGYNWYQGNYSSRIQINTDLDIFIERAIDVASHESYPGHHVYNMLLEKNLYHDKGWPEVSLYPLFSPQSLIAEGSANDGIDVAFPGDEKIAFASDVLLPLAGLDTNGISRYFKVLQIKGQLNFVRNEVARGIINHTMTETVALKWLMEYGLNNRETALKSISFINKYGSYVINYNYGQQLVSNYITLKMAGSTSTDKRWKLFKDLLCNEITPAMLLDK